MKVEYAQGAVLESSATTNGCLGSARPIVELSGRWLWCLGATLPASIPTSHSVM